MSGIHDILYPVDEQILLSVEQIYRPHRDSRVIYLKWSCRWAYGVVRFRLKRQGKVWERLSTESEHLPPTFLHFLQHTLLQKNIASLKEGESWREDYRGVETLSYVRATEDILYVTMHYFGCSLSRIVVLRSDSVTTKPSKMYKSKVPPTQERKALSQFRSLLRNYLKEMLHS